MSQGFTVEQVANGVYRAIVGIETKDFKDYVKATDWAIAKAYGLPLQAEYEEEVNYD